VSHLRTGDNETFREHDIAWLKRVFPVDYIFGFIETHTDVRERKGVFEGFVAIADPERDPPLQALARSALAFEQRMPWDSKWKRDSFQTPAAAAVTLVAATGFAGPMTFFGVNLPNSQEIRQKHGSKNFVVLSVGDTRMDVAWTKVIDEFAPSEARAEILRCARYMDYASISFHEVTGHGSGKVEPSLKDDPSHVLAPYFSTLEEGRAELVASYLMGDPKTVEIGLLPDERCARIFPQYKTMAILASLAGVPQGEIAEQVHLRGDLIALGHYMEKGAVTVEERSGETVLVVKDPDAWRRAAGELLAELQRIKATGDKAAIKALADKHGTRINTRWRDEVISRMKSLGLPSAVATIPPLLTPLHDGSGRIVDARAEQTASLDAYIAALEQAWAE
jgi:dipeptidyl-peptidase-3